MSQHYKSSASSSTLSQGTDGNDDDDDERLIGLLCNYMLVASSKMIPFTRGELGKQLPNVAPRKVTQLIAAAAAVLTDVFGYKVVGLQKKNSFMFVNTVKCENPELHRLVTDSLSETEAAVTGLRAVILATIFMSGGVIQEGMLRELLRNLDLNLDSKEKHPKFENLNKLIFEDFVKQAYLDVRVLKEFDPPCREISWGERAKYELSKKEVLELVCKIYGDHVQPEMWLDQWKEVQREMEASRNAVDKDDEDAVSD